MTLVELPDGTFASSAVYAGTGSAELPCAPDAHDWQQQFGPTRGPDHPDCTLSLQRCARCDYKRVIITPDNDEAREVLRHV